jgi:hypothetical protein
LYEIRYHKKKTIILIPSFALTQSAIISKRNYNDKFFSQIAVLDIYFILIIIVSGSTVLVRTLAASHGRFRNLF